MAKHPILKGVVLGGLVAASSRPLATSLLVHMFPVGVPIAYCVGGGMARIRA